MNRKQAVALIGQRVKVWTAANGEYAGELLEVFGSPWRGRVRITGILAVAQHHERGATCRRGFRVGEAIEAGNTSIRPTDATGCESYVEALDREIARCEAGMDGSVSSRSAWVWPAFRQSLIEVRAAEIERLRTGEWRLRPSASI